LGLQHDIFLLDAGEFLRVTGYHVEEFLGTADTLNSFLYAPLQLLTCLGLQGVALLHCLQHTLDDLDALIEATDDRAFLLALSSQERDLLCHFWG
jgi:hypothetical protein